MVDDGWWWWWWWEWIKIDPRLLAGSFYIFSFFRISLHVAFSRKNFSTTISLNREVSKFRKTKYQGARYSCLEQRLVSILTLWRWKTQSSVFTGEERNSIFTLLNPKTLEAPENQSSVHLSHLGHHRHHHNHHHDRLVGRCYNHETTHTKSRPASTRNRKESASVVLGYNGGG